MLGALALCLTCGIGTAAAAPTSTRDLTAAWWQTAFGAPSSLDRFVSFAGGDDNCRTVGGTVFAGGSFNLGDEPAPKRECTVGAGSTIVLPALNNIYVLYPKDDDYAGDTWGDANRANNLAMNGARVSATLDGNSVAVRRVQSGSFRISSQAFYDMGYTGDLKYLEAASLGYWVVLRLPAGTHSVTTYGQSRDGSFVGRTDYVFNVN